MTRRRTSPQLLHAELTPQHAQVLREQYGTQDTGDAVAKLLLAAAGLWILSELLTEEEKPRPRRKRKAS